MRTAAREAGSPGSDSIGGWPLGQEFVIRLDHPLPEDALLRITESAHAWDRIFVCLYFRCEIAEEELAAMRSLVDPKSVRFIVDPSAGDANAGGENAE